MYMLECKLLCGRGTVIKETANRTTAAALIHYFCYTYTYYRRSLVFPQVNMDLTNTYKSEKVHTTTYILFISLLDPSRLVHLQLKGDPTSRSFSFIDRSPKFRFSQTLPVTAAKPPPRSGVVSRSIRMRIHSLQVHNWAVVPWMNGRRRRRASHSTTH